MAERRKISLVLADVDGTLVTEQKVLTKRANIAWRKAEVRRLPAMAADLVNRRVAVIAATTSGCEWPRHETAAPPEASMYCLPFASWTRIPRPPTATG